MNILNDLENISELAKLFPCSSLYANSNFRRLKEEVNYEVLIVPSTDGQAGIDNHQAKRKNQFDDQSAPLKPIYCLLGRRTIAQNFSIFNYLHLISFSISCTHLIHEYVNDN